MLIILVLQSHLDAIVLDPDLQPLLALLKGVRNGIVYGAKVRFPHALVYVDIGCSFAGYGWC